MNKHEDVDRSAGRRLEVGIGTGPPSGIATPGRTALRASMASLLLLLTLALVSGATGSRLAQAAPVELGIFAPVAGRIVHGDERGIRGLDPAAPMAAATEVELTHGTGIPLGWSRDGRRLLLMRDVARDGAWIGAHLFVLRADGSETQLTERPMEIRSGTIAPDGSRVVFADTGALYSVDTDGGPAELLLASRLGILRNPTFAPDGTRIAYVDGRGDWGHTVWVVDVDGSDAHEILANETIDGIGHVRGLEWSPAGDRIALGMAQAIYTFGTDGSAFTRWSQAEIGRTGRPTDRRSGTRSRVAARPMGAASRSRTRMGPTSGALASPPRGRGTPGPRRVPSTWIRVGPPIMRQGPGSALVDHQERVTLSLTTSRVPSADDTGRFV